MEQLIAQYFSDKKLEYKDSKTGQFVLKRCPFCGDEKFHHFYMSKLTGQYHCKKCDESGGLNKFRGAFGDGSIQLPDIDYSLVDTLERTYRTLDNQIAMDFSSKLWAFHADLQDYLINNRKLTKEVLEEFLIGSDGANITIPIFEDGKLINIRTRKNPFIENDEPKYKALPECRSALFNGDILAKYQECYLTEGEFDAMQLIQRGLPNTVSVTLGANSFPKDWVEKFKNLKLITICFDADDAGKQGAEKVAKLLGESRCKIITLPSKPGRSKTDISNYFVDDGHEKLDFLELSAQTKKVLTVEDSSVRHISEFSDELRRRLIEGEYTGVPTGFKQLDELMGGLRRGRLVIVSGLTNTGKSSWAINVALSLAKGNQAIFYFSLEMPPIDIAKKLLMLESKLTNTDLKKVEDPSPVLTKIDEALVSFQFESGLPIYLYEGSGTVKYSILEESAKIARGKHNVQCIFVDHLHYFAQGSNNVTQETSMIVRKIKQLAMQLDIPIVLLAHLNRGGRTNQRKGMYIPSLSDLKETSSIEQDADQVIFVCRDSEAEGDDRQKAIIKLAKNRDGYAGRAVSMKFNEDIASFEEAVGVDYVKEQSDEKKQKSLDVDIEDISF